MESRSFTEIYFDGICNTCNSFVDFLLRWDRQDQFRFASLQSERAKKDLPPEWTREGELSSIVVRHEKRIYTKSAAILIILSELPAPLCFFRIFKVLPSGALDWLYDLIATNRYLLFGRRSTCRIPTFNEQRKFLD